MTVTKCDDHGGRREASSFEVYSFLCVYILHYCAVLFFPIIITHMSVSWLYLRYEKQKHRATSDPLTFYKEDSRERERKQQLHIQ